MRVFWGILFFLCSQWATAQIVVDTDLFTPEQLIRDVLINSNCAETSNYLSRTGTAQGVNGIGYFNANGSDFSFREGIVLSTGNAQDSEGPNVGTNSSTPSQWTGDPDLTIITGIQELFNASFLQFDFIPRTNNFSFNFLFASEEYNDEDGDNYQCIYSDAFAFILTGSDGVSRNLALLPDTNVPVSVTSIRPGIPGSCTEENIEYFGGINGDNSAISQYGQTVSLTAESLVIPNETYTIKLVIADNRDPFLDSAVFLEAGSFSTGVFLGEDRTVADGNPLCLGEMFELDATAQGAIGYNWYRDDVALITAQDQPTLNVTETGAYRVEVVFSIDCIAFGDIVVEFIETPEIVEEPIDLIVCDLDGDGTYVFDFTPNSDLMLGNQDRDTYSVYYYNNSADAENFENEITNSSAYTGTTPSELIYARISSGNSCNQITSFELGIQTIANLPTLESQYALCLDDAGSALAPLPTLTISGADNEYTFVWYRNSISPANEIPDATESSFVAGEAGTYHVVLGNIAFGCEFSLSTEVIVSRPPESFEVDVVSELFSDSNTVAVLTEGENNYLFSVDDGPFIASNRFSGIGPGAHVANVMDSNGCGITSRDFFIIGYPKFFTPNNDGSNDIWTISGLSEIENAEVTVYDRYGKLLYQFVEGPGWNGTQNGRQLPSTDYWFKISYLEEGIPREFKGHFALKR
ncbi:T9SS type B sorting domain-containing protein [Aggregatimonas sangjinii]|uniref:T9SS type B sorting domain-containing protein n=1 Tax=Aggregatimonas sangjinii TaxID=2583587 RepID=A0A5B7SQ78_9FLAO|nr:T9SS type B sorting domain-containing protein [Aggregatimonas sangjinii]